MVRETYHNFFAGLDVAAGAFLFAGGVAVPEAVFLPDGVGVYMGER